METKIEWGWLVESTWLPAAAKAGEYHVRSSRPTVAHALISTARQRLGLCARILLAFCYSYSFIGGGSLKSREYTAFLLAGFPPQNSLPPEGAAPRTRIKG